MPAVRGSSVGGRYRLERVIARGGMGSVWAAHDDQLDRPVALKLIAIDVEGSEGGEERFLREARLAARLRSPHVVEVFDYGVDGEVGTYLVQELLEGEDLAHLLRRSPRVDFAKAVLIVSQIGRALSAAHEAGTVHRDLKPANVFLASYESEVFVKVLDFGVAKARESDTTKTGELLGTLQYMSPEQTTGATNAQPQSDLWSLGVIAFEMLTGTRPFSGKGPGELVVSIRSGKAPSAHVLRRELPAAIDGFFERAFATKVENRFQTASELTTAFKELLEPSPVSAPRPAVLPASRPPAAKSADAYWWAAFGGVAATVLLGFCSLTTRGGNVQAPAAQDSTVEDYETQKRELMPKVLAREASTAEVERLLTLCEATSDADCRDKTAAILKSMKP